MLVGVEGLDGTGKSTIIPKVAKILMDRGLSISIKPEFPIGKLDSEFRSVLDKGLFLAQHLEMPAAAAFFYLLYSEVISTKKAYPNNDDIVLADRCHYTHSMYQAFFSCSNPKTFDVIKNLSILEDLLSMLEVKTADMIILLDASVDKVLPRLVKREGRDITLEETQVLENFHHFYNELYNRNKEKVVKVDATTDPDEVAYIVATAILERHNQCKILNDE